MTDVYTIGFTKHTAEAFFGKLRRAGIRRLIDTRLNNTSQLAGFAKREDLAWLLQELVGRNICTCPSLRRSLRCCPICRTGK